MSPNRCHKVLHKCIWQRAALWPAKAYHHAIVVGSHMRAMNIFALCHKSNAQAVAMPVLYCRRGTGLLVRQAGRCSFSRQTSLIQSHDVLVCYLRSSKADLSPTHISTLRKANVRFYVAAAFKWKSPSETFATHTTTNISVSDDSWKFHFSRLLSLHDWCVSLASVSFYSTKYTIIIITMITRILMGRPMQKKNVGWAIRGFSEQKLSLNGETHHSRIAEEKTLSNFWTVSH